MATPASQATPSSQDGAGGIDEQTLLIIVAAAAGTLLLTVIFLLCIVAYLYFRKDRVTQKKKQQDNLHRLFREPTNISSKFADIADLQDLEQASFFREMHRSSMKSQRSRRGSIRSTRSSIKSHLSRKNSTRKNPTFGKDDVYAGALEMQTRNKRGQDESKTMKAESANDNGIDNPTLDLSDEKRSSPENAQDATSSETNTVVIDAKVNILNPNTWRAADSEDKVPPMDPDDKVFTISGSAEEIKDHEAVPKKEEPNEDETGDKPDGDLDGDDGDDEDEEVDTYHMYSHFQRQHSQRRRSFKSRNSAVIDFYEGGAFDSASTLKGQTNKTPERDPFWDGFGPSSSSSAQGLLWQKKRIF